VRSMLEKGERLGPKQLPHLYDAKVAVIGQQCHLFDHRSGTYEVAEPGGTNEAREIRDGRKHIVVIILQTCTCRRPQQFHFPCSHMVAACWAWNVSVESMIPHDFSVQALLNTWSPRFVPFRDESEWPSYDGPKYVVDPEAKWPKKGTRKRTQYKMEMDRIPGRTRRGNGNPFVADPMETRCNKCLGTGHNVTCERR
jgi:hypothetical protein